MNGSIAFAMLGIRKVIGVFVGKPLFNELADSGTVGAESKIFSWPHGKISEQRLTVPQIEAARFPSLRAIKTYLIPQPELRRISVITDSISSGSLFGGVGTALIFAAHLANKMNATLRIITRTEKAPPENVEHVLSVYGIALTHELQFVFSSIEDQTHEVDIHSNELFLTTSWWTTAATLPSVPHASIVYLLQEDERMFYPFGEDRFRCEEVLRSTDIRFVVNTKLLFDHLLVSGLPHIAVQGQWFEPAFPETVFHPQLKNEDEKLRFFFYARPNNLRNLFHVGLTVIDRAINQGILDLRKWDIYLVGKNIPAVTFGDGSAARRCEDLDWAEYADLAGTVDLGLSLMYTPHPSYPPLDLAASGAVVVTNRFENKNDLSNYSSNIICVDPNVDALIDALRQGVALAESPARDENFRRNGVSKSWQISFQHILDSAVGAW